MQNPSTRHGRPTGDPERFGLWLTELMNRRRMTQVALAKAAGVNQGMVSRWRAGTSVPSPQSIKAIANVLEVPIGEAMLQAGHIEEVGEVSSSPERDRLHQLVDRLPLYLLTPYVAVFEAIINQEPRDE